MCITAHFIDDEWRLHKKILSFVPVTSHRGEFIVKALENCLLDWGLKKIFTVTVDNASSNDTAIQYFRKNYFLGKQLLLEKNTCMLGALLIF